MEILNEAIRAKVTEPELKQYAAEASKSIVIRSRKANGNSDDQQRETTPEEAETILRIVYGALLSIRYGRDIQAVADTAEFIAMQFLPGAGSSCNEPHTNTYDTIYLPIRNWVRQKEGEDA